MAEHRGRKRRTSAGAVLYARVDEDVLAGLDAGAAALGITRSAYLERVLREVDTDEHGLPAWVRAEIADSQLQLGPEATRHTAA